MQFVADPKQVSQGNSQPYLKLTIYGKGELLEQVFGDERKEPSGQSVKHALLKRKGVTPGQLVQVEAVREQVEQALEQAKKKLLIKVKIIILREQIPADP